MGSPLCSLRAGVTVKINGVHYGKSLDRAEIAHILSNQDDPFADKPVAGSLCGLGVFNYHASNYVGNRLCRSCLRLSQHLQGVAYRLPFTVEEF